MKEIAKIVIGMFIFTYEVHADVLTMRNGDTLTGEVIRQQGEVVQLKTKYAGILNIQKGEIKNLQLEPARGESPSKSSNQLKQKKKETPSVATPSSVDRGTTTGLSGLSEKPIAPGESVIPKSTHKEGFSGKVNFAAKLENGNSDSDEIDADFELRYRKGLHRYEVKGQIEYDRTRGVNTKRDWMAVGKYDRFINNSDYLSAWYGLKQEWFAGLDLRQFYGVGMGREFISEPSHRLSSELGVFFVDENFINVPDNRFVGPGFFLDYEREIIKGRLSFYHRNYTMLDSGDVSKFLWHSWTGFRFPIYSGFVASAEFEADYDSEPALHADRMDTTLRLKLGYQW